MSAFTTADNVSDVINVRQFLNEWAVMIGMVQSESVKAVSDDVTLKDLNVPEDIVEELALVCSPDTLKVREESQAQMTSDEIPDTTQLVTLQLQKAELKKREENEVYRRLAGKNLRYKGSFPTLQPSVPVKSVDLMDDAGPVAEVLLTVAVYVPYERQSTMPKPKVDEVLLVLGGQSLTELRDRISCTSDYQVAGEFSENPNNPQDIKARLPGLKFIQDFKNKTFLILGFLVFSGHPRPMDLYKSGFFFIEGTFYNDMRHGAESTDYSKVIIDWARDPRRGIGPFTTALMEDTKFIDLNIRLGQPYLYQHQGNCEHLIVFKDMRLMSGEDTQDMNQYPLCIFRFHHLRVPCVICQTLTAKWQVRKCVLAPKDPCHMCDACFRAFLYDKDNCKVVDFEAYPFIDRTAIIPRS